MKKAILAGVLAAALPLAAGAEVKSAAADGFLIEHRFTIAAPAARVWESLLHPERWWPADHTWSGKRENLSLDADDRRLLLRALGRQRRRARARRPGHAGEAAAARRRARAAAGDGGIGRDHVRARGEGRRDDAGRHASRQRRRGAQARRACADRRPGERAAVRGPGGGRREALSSPGDRRLTARGGARTGNRRSNSSCESAARRRYASSPAGCRRSSRVRCHRPGKQPALPFLDHLAEPRTTVKPMRWPFSLAKKLSAISIWKFFL